MDPRHLFADERYNVCVYCGGPVESRDHVPSRVLLDDPLPPDLPFVGACVPCNSSSSLDEQYLACFIECVVAGTTDPDCVSGDKVREALRHAPALRSEIKASRGVGRDGAVWRPNESRVRGVLLKLARGHAAYECSAPRLDEPQLVGFAPLLTLSEHELEAFETIAEGPALSPEIGSRAFTQVLVAGSEPMAYNCWRDVQDGRYRYLVSSDGDCVRVVLSEYLACEVVW